MADRDITEPHIDPDDPYISRQTSATRGVATTIASITTCIVAAIHLAGVALAMTFFVPTFAAIYEDFGTRLPRATVWLMELARFPVVTVAVMGTLLALLVLKEALIRDRRVTLVINLGVLFVGLMALPTIILALVVPLEALLKAST